MIKDFTFLKSETVSASNRQLEKFILDSSASNNYTNDRARIQTQSVIWNGTIETAGKENLAISAEGIHREYVEGNLGPKMGWSLLSIGQMTRDENTIVTCKDDR